MRLFLRLATTGLIVISSLSCKGKRETTVVEKAPVASSQQIINRELSADPDEMRRQRNLARAANIAWIKEVTKKYSPESWYLLMQYDALPAVSTAPATGNGVASTEKHEDTFSYLRGRSKTDVLASMEKNVHEISHAYFSQNAFRYITDNNLEMNPDNAQGYIYISPSKGFFISFPLKALFPSRELAGVIPKDMRTYRFDTYIQGITSTQSEGVIGLLNELHAYYNGSRYCFEMLEPYKIAAGSAGSGLFDWVTYTQSTMSAYYEFDYYIMEYLLLMRERYPSDYELLRSNAVFSDAFRYIRGLYEELIRNYTDLIRSEMKILNASRDASARLEKGWLWVKAEKSNVSSGTPVFSDPREKLLPVLESRRYREIENDFNLR
jgi:hypothetical protein